MKKEQIDLSTMGTDALKRLINDRDVLMRLEMHQDVPNFKVGTVTGVKARGPFRCRAQISYDAGDGAADLLVTRVAGTWTTNSGSRKLVAWRTVQVPVETPEPGRPLKPVEDPMTCELRVGDTVEVVFKGGIPHQGTITKLLSIDRYGFVVAKEDGTPARHFSQRSSVKLIARAGTPVQATLVEPLKPAPKEEFSDKGIMPSDHPGINEMLKKGFKEIFGGDMTGAKAPAKRTLPSSKALFMVTSEKYLGLGFNDERP